MNILSPTIETPILSVNHILQINISSGRRTSKRVILPFTICGFPWQAFDLDGHSVPENLPLYEPASEVVVKSLDDQLDEIVDQFVDSIISDIHDECSYTISGSDISEFHDAESDLEILDYDDTLDSIGSEFDQS